MQPQSLFVEVVEQANLVFVRLEGVINEDNRLPERVPSISGKKLLVHVGKVERINSCGVRDWVRWIQGLELRQNSVHVIDCSPVLVAQMNMVRNFFGARGRVVTFQAPYYCASCEREHRETFTTATLGVPTEAPEALCEKCGELLVFDDIPENYFEFTRQHSAAPVDQEVDAAISRFKEVQLATKVAALKDVSSGSRVSQNTQLKSSTSSGLSGQRFSSGNASVSPAPAAPAAGRAEEELTKP